MKEHSRIFLGQDSHNTYPHMNGYTGHGTGVVYRRNLQLRHRNLLTGEEKVLFTFSQQDRGGGVWDIALDAPRLAMPLNNSVVIMDLDAADKSPWVAFSTPHGGKPDGLCSLSPDGTRLLTRHVADGLHIATETDLETGEARELFSMPWFANHMHYCPHDPEWVGFSHEGWTEDIPDRCWVWHRKQAPAGRLVFDQQSEVTGKHLCVGHEHWCFHDVSAYAPAYMHSPAGPRGLYEVFGDGRPPVLRWPSDIIWHCTMDLSGRYVAVDTAGPFKEEPYTDAQYRHYLEIFKRQDAANEPMDGDVVILDLETRDTLWLAEAQWIKHPYHPHPAISPDARWVTWNDSRPEKKGMWLAEISTN